ncbi:unnamed protein product, partial [Ixodes persulcatus]
AVPSPGLGDEQEYRLTRYLMSNYDPAVRPSFNSSLPLRVDLELVLLQLLQVDEKSQTISTNCRLTQQRWTDAHLKWNASDFGGIGVLRIPAAQVWKPDLVLYNNARGDYRSGQLSSNVIVKWTGEVAFPVQAVLTSACQLELHYFPFDVHNCHLHFVSWTYDSFQLVELEPSRTAEALTRFQRHGEFELVGLSVSQRMHHSDDGGGLGAPAAHRDVTYSVRLRRRPGFHLFHLVLPCLLVNALALLSFFVPCESGEKVTLGINTLLCVAVFLVVVRDSLPPGGTMLPLISVYYGLTICVVACTTGLSVLTLSLHHRGARGVEVPRSLRRLVLGFLAKLFLVGCCAPHGDDAQRKVSAPESGAPHGDLWREDSVSIDTFSAHSLVPAVHYRVSRCESAKGRSKKQRSAAVFGKSNQSVYETIEKSEVRVAERDRRDALRTEWHQVAAVCDRFLLAVFLLSTALATFLVLFSSPPALPAAMGP